MEKPYIAIYKEALDKRQFTALRAQVARRAFTKLSGWRSDYILDVYKFTFKMGGPAYAAYVIDHALPHAEAHLRSHLLAQFDRLGVDH